MARLPNDVLLDILSRLPVKTLSKFKCVSKSWCNLISSPRFLRVHRNQSKQNLHLLFLSHEYLRGIETFTSMDTEGRVRNVFTANIGYSYLRVLPTRSDLICITTINNCVFLCNPSTQELLALPDGSLENYVVGLGFGYLSSTKEYKVVRLFLRVIEIWKGYDSIGCEIFTIGGGNSTSSPTSSWKVIKESCPPYFVDDRPAFVNEAIHWKLHHERSLTREGEFILSFDVVNEKFRTITYPSDCSNIDRSFTYLAELGGMLCIVESINATMGIWMLKDYDNQVWEKQYNIKMPEICEGVYHVTTPRDMIDGELIMTMATGSRVWYFYDIENKSFRTVEMPCRVSHFGFYTESFFALGHK